MSRVPAHTLAHLRACLANVEGLSLLRKDLLGQQPTCHQQVRCAKAQARESSPHKYQQDAKLLAWEHRRRQARPAWNGRIRNPYSRLEEPRPWAAKVGPFLERTAQLRPENKNRKRWDRIAARQLQVMVRMPHEAIGRLCVRCKTRLAIHPREGTFVYHCRVRMIDALAPLPCGLQGSALSMLLVLQRSAHCVR